MKKNNERKVCECRERLEENHTIIDYRVATCEHKMKHVSPPKKKEFFHSQYIRLKRQMAVLPLVLMFGIINVKD